MSEIPKITESQIKALTSNESYTRGLAYYRDGTILNPEREGMTLRAQVKGREYRPYNIRIELDVNGIADLSCNCPYEYGGLCKHLVAVLLTFVHQPQKFLVQLPLRDVLAQYSREELIVIIERMVKRNPKLRKLINIRKT